MTDTTADLSTLCQSCGLCCDGSLFGRVPLDPEEDVLARRNRLRVLDNGKAFEQPCTALGESSSGARRICSIYDERPLSCRRFTCRLLDRHRREGGPLGPRVAAIQRVRRLVAELQAEGLTPADMDGHSGARSPAMVRALDMVAELQRRLEDDFARA